MCGIIGYVGPRSATQVAFDALKKMEYRGYDSAGIAVCHEGRIALQKAEGKLGNLEGRLAILPQGAGTGIGHTRWATHGEPTERNAHPHHTENVALVHNGIIENYAVLKKELLAEGVRFLSETDTEVIVQLVERELKKHRTAKDAILAVVRRLHGAYALGILIRAEPDALYVVKHGSPIVVGLGPDEGFFASDVTALGGQAQQVAYLNDGDSGKVTRKSVELWNTSGESVAANLEPLNWNAVAIEKAGFRHFMLKEIHEQSTVIANSILRFIDRQKLTLNMSELAVEKLDTARIDSIHFVACGTAHYAGMIGKYLLEPMLDIPVTIELASEFRYRQPHLSRNALVVAVSQSGETADTLASIKFAKAHGCQVFSVCNVQHSSIPRECQATLYMQAGPEIGVASTKAFSSQVLCIYLFGLALARERGRLREKDLAPIFEELLHLPVLIEGAVAQKDRIATLAEKYYEFPNFLYVGRGVMFPVALEGALKLKEISYIHAEGYAAGELKHGPIALVDRHMPIVALMPRDAYYEKSFSNAQEIAARKGILIGIGDDDNEDLKEICADLIPCPSVKNPAFQAILSVIPLQLLSYYIAVKRGTDVDQPRNLAKSVTVE